MRWLEEQIRLSQARRFGPSSERTHPDQLSLLFNEAEISASPANNEPTLEEVTYKRRTKQRGHREAMLEDLPEEIIEHDFPESEKICDQCDGPMHRMSTEERRELVYIPAQVKVVRHLLPVFSCRHCEQEGVSTPIVTASMPAPPIPGSLASPSMIAHVMNQKYVDALPLYRQEQQFDRLGIELSRQTLANWVVLGSDRWLSIIYDRLYQELLKRDVLQADETKLQVLHEPGRAPETQSFMWLYRTGRDGPPIVLFEYQQTRAGEHPKTFLSGFTGYLQTDGYAGYHDISGATLVGCFAHARRKFDEALKALPSSARSKGTVAAQIGLQYCNDLFTIEKRLKGVPPGRRKEQREALSEPLLERFHTWLKDQAATALPKSALATAVNYCLNQWDKLTAFLLDGRLEIDNNRSERSIKPFVIGRKNWLFANTPKGARASAVIYSIVETAKENGLKPYDYLKHLFEQLPNVDVTDLAELDQLLPWSGTLPDACRMHSKIQAQLTANNPTLP